VLNSSTMKSHNSGLGLGGLSFSKHMRWSPLRIMLCALLALTPMGCQHEMTPEEFIDLSSRAEKGDPKAQYDLAHCYANGGGGAEKNLERTLYWCSKSAEQGYPRAQLMLGSFYISPSGGNDRRKGIELYRKAAEQGNADAQRLLAAHDPSRLPVAQAAHLLPVDTAALARYRRFRLNASLGDAHAPNSLGEFYLTGEDVAKNEIEAYAYFNLPRACGHAEANRQRLVKKLSSADILRGQQRTKELQKELEHWEELQKEIDGLRK